ncbi:MAG: amidohydrolase family protein [Cyanosarcina radialis HA8281-LM2]|jgi:N-acyl-D-glutamate deacylase|nr:amidohydrolase family protein [Cyanosarcina radialis HA8281-LM2]
MKSLKNLVIFCLALILAGSISISVATARSAQTYDIVIKGGRVIDPETQLDGRRNVGIKGDKIAAISESSLAVKKVFDAAGMVVAPGFIDLHAHGQQIPAARMQAFDGVTTGLELESGLLPVREFYETVAKEGRPINYGASSSWVSARIAVLNNIRPEANLLWFQKAFALDNWQYPVATPEQLAKIVALVEQGLKEGGIGIGIDAGYSPGNGSKEFYSLGALAAKYNVPTYTHIRNFSNIDPKSSFEAYLELVAVSTTTGAHMHICHLNSTSSRDIKVFPMLEAAQKKGANITVEAYPYGGASTVVGAEILRGNWRDRMGMQASDIEFEGKPLNDQTLNEMQSKTPGAPIVFHFLREDQNAADRKQLDESVLYPGGIIASDGMPWATPDGNSIDGGIWPLPKGAFAHPRSSGTFSRFLRVWVRERKSLPLMDALAKTSLIPAQILEKSTPQMRNKGRLQVGKDADLVVFNLNTIADRSTYTQPAQTATGMKYVLVNGVPLIQNGELNLKVLPGKPMRRNPT